jgi:branched-chain amino acid transport system substrate-binding protein
MFKHIASCKGRLWRVRRTVGFFVLAMFIAIAPAQAENGVNSEEIVLGQSTALSGPLAELGTDASVAAKAYFDYVNAQGGVNGRKIRLITLDDGNSTDRGVANVKSLIDKEKVFALLGRGGRS